MHSSIGQNTKSLGVSGLRCPVTVDKTVTSFMDRSSPTLEHSFYVWCASKDLFETDPCCHGNEKFGILTQKLAITPLI